MVEPDVLQKLIRDRLSADHVVVDDLTGTKDHFQAVVVAAAFEGKTRVEQHQAVYAALGELMKGPVHALALTTYTPGAWAKKNA
ncbi:MAG: BolA family transcriptional regulator [Sandaracinaceae bacterium]|nr:BolA family transcriptional regulator [Sandaracinaceae bacterium]